MERITRSLSMIPKSKFADASGDQLLFVISNRPLLYNQLELEEKRAGSCRTLRCPSTTSDGSMKNMAAR